MSSGAELNLALRKLVKDFGIPLSKLATSLEISPKECLEWWSHPKKRLPVGRLREFVSSIGIKEESFVATSVPRHVVEIGILGFKNQINPKYSRDALSYTLSSKHIVEYIRLRYGNSVANSILIKLGVPPSFFEDNKNRISINFYEDLLSEYVKLGNSLADICMLSRAITLTADDDPDGQRLFPFCRTYAEAFHRVEVATKSFDENFDYSFEIKSDRARIVTRPSERLADSMKDPQYGSRELYLYRSQLIGNIVGACGLDALKMVVTKCVSQGDKVSVYEVEYPDVIHLGRHF